MRIRCLCACIVLAASGCRAHLPTPAAMPSCDATERPMVRDTLYFGRRIPGGGYVDDAAWRSFLDEAVTPRFPDGLTVAPATGQWRGADGRVVAEPTQVLILLHAGDAASRDRIAAIVSDYRQRFAQESVLRERVLACAAF